MFRSTLSWLAITVVVSNGTVFGEQADFAERLMDADEAQFAAMFPKGIVFTNFENRVGKALPILMAEFDRNLPSDASDEDKEKLAKRQVNAAVILLRLNQSEKLNLP